MAAILGAGRHRQAQLGDGSFQKHVIPSPRPSALTPPVLWPISLAAIEHYDFMALHLCYYFLRLVICIN
jgi:hypothetical protein